MLLRKITNIELTVPLVVQGKFEAMEK